MLLASNFSFDEQLSHRSLGDAPEPRQPSFGVGISSFSLALSAQLWVPVAFRQAAFASWFFLFPLRRSAFLTGGLLRISTRPEIALGFPRSACARYNWGGVPSLLRGWVPSSVENRPRIPVPFHYRCSRFDDLV